MSIFLTQDYICNNKSRILTAFNLMAQFHLPRDRFGRSAEIRSTILPDKKQISVMEILMSPNIPRADFINKQVVRRAIKRKYGFDVKYNSTIIFST
jgi:hypothetical protein